MPVVTQQEWETLQAMYKIMNQGKDAVMRKRGDGYIVLEETKKIKYSAQRIGVV